MVDMRSMINEIEKENILLRLLPTDYNVRLSREAAAAIAGSDRKARKIIQELRNEGHRICSDSGRPGYYLAQTEADYMRIRKELSHRAYELLRTIRAMDAGPIPGQVEMGEKS